MNKWLQKVELVTNILVIFVAVLIIGVLVQRYLFTRGADQPTRVEPTVGKPVNLPGEDWSARPKTVVLALQTTCHFCNESAPFYKRLVEFVKDKNIKIVAIFPQSGEESTAHLNHLGVTGMEVKQAPVSLLETSGTPTLVITNDKGEVTNYWIGRLSRNEETEVIKKLESGGVDL